MNITILPDTKFSYMIRTALFLLLFFTQHYFIQAEIYPRYNHAGYATKGNKSFIILSDENLKGLKWSIKNSTSTIVLEGTFALSLSNISDHTPKPFNYEIDFSSIKKTGVYTISIGTYKDFSIEVKDHPTDFIISEMISFLKKQRSGVEVAPENKTGHSGDIKCLVYDKKTTANTSWKTAATERYVDMSGGWYDAGDYLKFTQTIAYTTYFLLRSYEEYPANAQASVDKKVLMNEALWGLDYLLKTMPDDSTFIIQVGNAEDHKQGPRMPYNDALNGSRHAYSDFSPTQMGLTAASLALASHIFESDLSLKIKSRPYRTKAIQIYKKAIAANKVPAWFEEGWEKFYNDATAEDNMELAAIELYRLTQDEIYLNEAKAYAMKTGAAYWYSWGNLNMTAHLRVFQYAPQTVQTYLTTDLNNFNGIATKKENIWRLPHAYTWASLYSFMGVASSAMMYTHLKEEQTSYNRMGTDVLNYTLGQNNWGKAFIITEKIPGSVKHIYSQMYTLHPELSPIGAIAEGPGDKKTHDDLLTYFNIPKINPYEMFNTNEVVFYDYESDFQCMETTIGGMADGIYFFTLINKFHGK